MESPERSALFNMLRYVIQNSLEVVVPSVDASSNNAFGRLGLADSALLHTVSADRPVVTADLGLYLAVIRKDPDAVVNFTFLRSR